MKAPIWVLALGALTTAGALGTTTNSETLLQTSFDSAFAKQPAASAQIAKSAPVAGSEEFWLSAIPGDPATALTKTVAAGDKISMTFGGVARTLEVASVAEFEPSVTAVETAKTSGRLVLVTAKDIAKPDANLVRFVIEVETPAAATITGATPRAL